MTQAWLNRIGTAVPPHDIHAEFVDFARTAAGGREKPGTVRPHGGAGRHRASLLNLRAGAEAARSRARQRRLLSPWRVSHHGCTHGAVSRCGARAGTAGDRRAGHRGGTRDDHPPDRGELHRLYRAGTRFPHHAGRRPRDVGRAHYHRLHGLLRRGERAEAGPPYRAVGTEREGAGGQSGIVQPASAGRVGAREDAELPAVRRWVRRLPGVGRTGRPRAGSFSCGGHPAAAPV